MSDLKTPWTNPAMSAPDLSGAGVTQRGGDPNASMDGSNGLSPAWNNAPVPVPGGSETSNSVSGLPGTPSRWEPTETPPAPPSLKDRSPGTIDQQ